MERSESMSYAKRTKFYNPEKACHVGESKCLHVRKLSLRWGIVSMRFQRQESSKQEDFGLFPRSNKSLKSFGTVKYHHQICIISRPYWLQCKELEAKRESEYEHLDVV